MPNMSNEEFQNIEIGDTIQYRLDHDLKSVIGQHAICSKIYSKLYKEFKVIKTSHRYNSTPECLEAGTLLKKNQPNQPNQPNISNEEIIKPIEGSLFSILMKDSRNKSKQEDKARPKDSPFTWL